MNINLHRIFNEQANEWYVSLYDIKYIHIEINEWMNWERKKMKRNWKREKHNNHKIQRKKTKQMIKSQ